MPIWKPCLLNDLFRRNKHEKHHFTALSSFSEIFHGFLCQYGSLVSKTIYFDEISTKNIISQLYRHFLRYFMVFLCQYGSLVSKTIYFDEIITKNMISQLYRHFLRYFMVFYANMEALSLKRFISTK